VEFIGEDDDDPYVARSLDCVDVHGRVHKLLFKIFEENQSDYDGMITKFCIAVGYLPNLVLIQPKSQDLWEFPRKIPR
jgi:hypothetical protein